MSGPLYMLDTDTCIFLMRGQSPSLDAKVESVAHQQLAMSAVTLAELSFGVHASAAAQRRGNQALLDALASHVAVADWPREAAEHYAAIRFDLKKRGSQLGANDLMIASHARAIGATVVTNNTKDFGRVKDLAIENWLG